MEIPSRIVSRMLLLSLLVLIIPMIIFPARLGTELLNPSPLIFLLELFAYGAVVSVFNRHLGLGLALKAGMLCLVFRVILGISFGLLVTIMYATELRVSVTMGISSYLPAMIIHMLSTPFILQPMIRFYGEDLRVDKRRHAAIRADAASGRTTVAISKSRGVVNDPSSVTPILEAHPASKAARNSAVSRSIATGEINGFERAIRYIGEDGSVFVAAVVDAEGLLMANFKRREAVAEDWAPLARLLLESNAAILMRGNLGRPSKVDLMLDDKRVVVAEEASFHLMVVAERRSDDILNVRINQALEIIRKYTEARYPALLVEHLERIHVSGTE